MDEDEITVALSHGDSCLCPLCGRFIAHEIELSEMTSDSALRAWDP